MPPHCSKCNEAFAYRVPRGFFIKKFLFFLPIRRYFCDRCLAKRYVWQPNDNSIAA